MVSGSLIARIRGIDVKNALTRIVPFAPRPILSAILASLKSSLFVSSTRIN